MPAATASPTALIRVRSTKRQSTRLVRILIFVGIVLGLNFGATWLAQQLNFQIFPRHDTMLNMVVLGTAALYVLLVAIPFMPGIEIGLALMILLGNKGALLVYLCTIVALSISFTVGRMMSLKLLMRLLKWLHLDRVRALLAELEPLDGRQRLDLMYAKAPTRAAPFLLKHRYLAVMALVNLPGNALIGGGGGISLVAGMSRFFSFPIFVPLMAIAVAPVPLLFYFGIIGD